MPVAVEVQLEDVKNQLSLFGPTLRGPRGGSRIGIDQPIKNSHLDKFRLFLNYWNGVGQQQRVHRVKSDRSNDAPRSILALPIHLSRIQALSSMEWNQLTLGRSIRLSSDLPELITSPSPAGGRAARSPGMSCRVAQHGWVQFPNQPGPTRLPGLEPSINPEKSESPAANHVDRKNCWQKGKATDNQLNI
ncbi:hypothetical protein PTTG_02392 [Puccinia triticina 1-1 BBBD Race 1]|uniref:Uncharacterized protein n=1 Tax=Puccinia triticina (isolate 1-1 / race 1 (BBBD)) TaxID=630390 RepID=A0A180H228_PUCT1|nr:hypothetical protein PTTG_02392 [Puccinia triticina 1-1 BBBD Race 1]